MNALGSTKKTYSLIRSKKIKEAIQVGFIFPFYFYVSLLAKCLFFYGGKSEEFHNLSLLSYIPTPECCLVASNNFNHFFTDFF